MRALSPPVKQLSKGVRVELPDGSRERGGYV
jgi:hypothetical protein